VIFFGESHLRRVVEEYLDHYHRERNHQGLDNKIIEPGREIGRTNGNIRRRERLGGMCHYYYRDAA
jgi:putative transposase